MWGATGLPDSRENPHSVLPNLLVRKGIYFFFRHNNKDIRPPFFPKARLLVLYCMNSYKAQKANWLLLGIYSIVLVLLVWRHEMWRDELHTWTIVTHAQSLGDLFYIKRYEGHPALWYLLLWPLAQLSADPIWLQVVHTALAIGTASLVVFRSPFRFWEKALLLFSYYLLFEYGAISRNYQIGMLLAFGIATLWPQATKQPLWVGIGLALLFQTNAFAILVGVGVGGGWLWLLVKTGRLFTPMSLLAMSVAGLGLVLGLLSTTLPPDASFNTDWYWQGGFDNLIDAITTVHQGLLPFPEFRLNFWNTQLLSGTVVPLLLSIGSLAAICWFFRKEPVSLITFLIPVLLIIFFTFFRYHGSLRHYGHYMISLVVSYWLYRTARPEPESGIFWAFQVLLLVQTAAGLYATYMDGRYAFSMARPLARYLNQTYPNHVAVAGSYNQLLTPVAGYLRRDVYTLSTQRWGSYVLWNSANWSTTYQNTPDSVLFANYLSFQRQHPNSVLVMAYQPFSHPDVREGSRYRLRTESGTYQFRCVKTFAPAIVSDENYYIYQLDADGQPER